LISTGAAYGGVVHPPGYPVWTIYSWLFVKLLPYSNIAWRVTVGSAVAAALASGLVALMVSRGGQLLLESPSCNAQGKDSCRVVCGCVAGLALLSVMNGLGLVVSRYQIVIGVPSNMVNDQVPPSL